MNRAASYARISTASLAIGVVTALGGVGIDRVMHHDRPIYLSDTLEGALAALVSGVTLERMNRRRQDLLRRMQAVEDVNHHVRNALTVVTYSAALREDPVLDAIVRDASRRIDWTLRSVLPGAIHGDPAPPAEAPHWTPGFTLPDQPPPAKKP